MIKLQAKVKKVLIDCPETRNSDITLTIEVWKQFYGIVESVALEQLYKLPREDNIKRIRARFCEENEPWAFPTRWEVAKARGINEDKWRKFLKYPDKEETTYSKRDISYIQKLL